MYLPIILDIEASGFGVGSYPIEIGYADASGATWSALVQPQAGWLHWDHKAETLHQQSRQQLVEHGKTPHDIATHLNLTFTGQTLYTDGWYQDFVWLHSLYDAAGMNPSFKLEDLGVLLTVEQQSIWHDTNQTVRDTFELPEHRAAMDAKALQLTWLKTAESAPVLIG